ncbi:MAG TPA: RNA polymerase sigma factor [Acidobacteriaceae bacterium]|nr:RNA polymerase sigma factor [Acidobacteriaceae bacterium]
MPSPGNISQMGMTRAWLKSDLPKQDEIIREPEAGAYFADEELLERVRQCDENALLELYDRYQAPIYRFAFAMSGDPSLAADITQDVFVLMLERRGLFGWLFARFDPRKGSLEQYLLGVARKLTRKHAARQSRWLAIDSVAEPGSLTDLGEEVESRFMVGKLRAAVALLPIKYREAVVLCCLQEKSYEEAAGILECSLGTVASRLSRGRKLLLDRLGTDDTPRRPMSSMARQQLRS